MENLFAVVCYWKKSGESWSKKALLYETSDQLMVD